MALLLSKTFVVLLTAWEPSLPSSPSLYISKHRILLFSSSRESRIGRNDVRRSTKTVGQAALVGRLCISQARDSNNACVHPSSIHPSRWLRGAFVVSPSLVCLDLMIIKL
ncbi:hypothetical protein F4778DRAFT_736606 [Xylariomycetidae sp. FL2044]|nr:hypothetical protein F4778DRAFT_736606 [Xylariomycetidae sp. FL2044]